MENGTRFIHVRDWGHLFEIFFFTFRVLIVSNQLANSPNKRVLETFLVRWRMSNPVCQEFFILSLSSQFARYKRKKLELVTQLLLNLVSKLIVCQGF